MSHVLDRIAGAPRRRRLVGLAACLLLATAAVAFWRTGDPPRTKSAASAAGHRCTGAATPGARPAAERARHRDLALMRAMLRKLDETTYEIDRALLEGPALGRLLTRAMRIVPAMENGRPVGFRVYFRGLHRGPLGLRSGDLLSTLNGVPLAERESPMGTFRAMFDADSVELRGTRDGQPLVRTLRIR